MTRRWEAGDRLQPAVGEKTARLKCISLPSGMSRVKWHVTGLMLLGGVEAVLDEIDQHFDRINIRLRFGSEGFRGIQVREALHGFFSSRGQMSVFPVPGLWRKEVAVSE